MSRGHPATPSLSENERTLLATQVRVHALEKRVLELEGIVSRTPHNESATNDVVDNLFKAALEALTVQAEAFVREHGGDAAAIMQEIERWEKEDGESAKTSKARRVLRAAVMKALHKRELGNGA